MDTQTQTFTPTLILQILLAVVLIPFLPLLISGRWEWWEAWLYAIVYIFGFAISRGLAARRHPDLLRERAAMLDHEDVKSWDKALSPLSAFGGAFLLIVAGLDARFGWTFEFGLTVKVVALTAILLGYGLGSYALIENRFFSGVVRIQRDRGHTVVSSGPYRWIRHPGYAGALIVYLATPFFLDSLWAIPFALLLLIILVLRTALEDQTLQEELPGYREYTQHVRFRLVPGIW